MEGGGVRIEVRGQPAGPTRGTKGDGRNERSRQMGGGGVRRGNTATSRTMRGLEVGGARQVAEVISQHGRRLLDGEVRRDGSLMAMDGVTAPRRRGMARRLLDCEGRRDGSSTARDGAMAPRWRGMVQRLLNGKGRRAMAP